MAILADQSVPDHVPPHLVADFDIWSDAIGVPDLQYAFVNKLHKGVPDIIYTPRNGGHWTISRMDHAFKVALDGETFSNVRANGLPESLDFRLLPVHMDGADHLKHRMLLMQFLAPKDTSKQEPHIRELCAKLIDGLAGRNSCDFKSEIAVPLPVSIFLAIMDWDVSRLREFVGWTLDIIASNDLARVEASLPKLRAYLAEEITRRQANPGDDPISLLLASKIDGIPLTTQRVLEMATTLFIGGTDTVTNALTFFMLHLAKNLEFQRRLRDRPEEIDVAVEELLRRYAFVNVNRRVTRDVVFEGVQMREGDLLKVCLAAASNDDRWIDNPEYVDLSRGRCRHLAFNTGPHACIGAPLARSELRIFLAEWLKRMPEVRLADGFTPRPRGGGVMSLDSLEIVW